MASLLIRGNPVPLHVPGYGGVSVQPLSHLVAEAMTPSRQTLARELPDIEACIDACELRDGAVVSFHHHLRNGDMLVNAVVAALAARGIRNVTIAASALFPVHAPLIEHIRNGTISSIWTSYIKGPLADAISAGVLPKALVLQSHGGRARAIASRHLRINAAFIAAPCADLEGAATGGLGSAACGPLGYAMVDADYADKVVVVTDMLQHKPLVSPEITADRVDYLVRVPSIGDAAGIVSGTTRVATDKPSLLIADLAARTIAASGVLCNDFSFQTGAGGISLAVASHLGHIMAQRGIRGDFVSGGITGAHVALLRQGLFSRMYDVQSFDLEAAESFKRDHWHHVMSAAEYASPLRSDAVCNRLSTMVLGAAEIDLGFNVNVSLGSDGRLLGGPGGHPDTAAGAQLTIVTTRTRSGQHPKIVRDVTCITTPGRDIDVLVTERGIAVNPKQEELRERLRSAGLPLVAIEELLDESAPPRPVASTERRLVGLMEYRDGSVIDTIAAVPA